MIQEQFHSGSKPNFEKYYQKGDSYRIEIQDVGNPKKEWKKVIARVTHLKKNESVVPCDETVVLFIQTSTSKIELGDELTLNAPLEKITNKGNPGEFDSEFFWKSKGITKIGFVPTNQFIKIGNSVSWIQKWTTISRNYLSDILAKHFKNQELAIAQALILGDRNFLDNETTNAFGNSGAMHVLAVSGLHIGIILGFILYLLKGFSKIINRKKALIIALLLIWVYTFISGLSASVLRATFMFSVLAISQIYGKNYNPINSLFFTGFCLLIYNPFFLFDIGFQLSFLAMLGIFWFYKPISRTWYIKNKYLHKIWEGTAVGVAAQVLTVPLTLYYFHQFPNYFILTNIGLMASTGLILGIGMFVFAFSWLKFIGKIAILLLTIALSFTLKFVLFIDDLPGSVASGFVLNEAVVIVFYLIILTFYIFKNYSFKFNIGISLISFCLITFVIYNRYNQLISSEICFFNSTKLTISIKNKNELFCFYNATKTELDKIKFMVESYRKVYPANVHYFSIKNRDWKLKSKNLTITIQKRKQGRLIAVNNTLYYVKTYENDTTSIKNAKVILMPWLVNGNHSEHSLKNGGLQFSLQ